MAQCHADGRKHPSAMDMYVGVLHSKLYSPNRDVDKYPHWSGYNTTAGGYNRTTESFRKEPTSDSRPSLLGGSFREDTLKTVAALPKVDPSHEAKSLRNGSYTAAAGPDYALQKNIKGGELLLQSLDLPHGSSNDSLAYRRNGNSMEKESKLLPTSKDAPVSDKVSNVSNPLRKEKEDLIINARGLKSSDSQPINWEAKSLSSDAALVPHSGAATGKPRTQIKSEELDAVNNCNGMLKSRNSNEQANNYIRIHKSAEQSVAYTNKGRLNGGNLEGGTRLYKSGEQIAANCSLNVGNLKEPPNGGLIVGSLKVGGYSSADSSSSIGGSPTAIKDGGRWSSAGSHGSADSSLSIGGSPTAKDGCRRSSFSNGGSSDGGNPMAKDVLRRSSTGGYGSADSSGSSVGSPTAKDGGRRLSNGSILNNKDCPTSASIRGMGNILGGGNMHGNMGKLKVSCSKASCNDPLRSGDSPAKKSDDMVLPNCNANVRGLSTPRVCVEGSLNGNLGNLCPGHWNAHASNGNILSHGLLVKTNSKLGEGIRNGCELDDPEDIKNAGNEQYKKGHFSEAVALYDESIAMCPNHAPYRSNRAAALTGLGRLGEAVQECEEAIRLDPQYSRAHLRVAHLYLRLGLIESAKRHFQAAGQQADAKDVQSLQTVERHISRCIEGRKVGDWRSVLRESNAAVVAGADSAPQVLGYKSEALLKLHRPEEAEAVCAEAQRMESSLRKLGVAPAESFLHMLRAHIEMSLGRFEGAIGAAESAAQIDPRNPEAVGLLRKARAVGQTRISGNELFNAGRFFEACAVYGEGLESDPTNAVLLCNRAACRSKLGQWEKAIEDCDAALVAQPNYIKALMRRANCSTKLERWEDALRDYEVLRREMPDDMEVARGFFDVQVAIKKTRGEEIYKMKFGGDVEEVFDKDQFREVVTSPGLSVVQFITRWGDRCRQISSFVNQLCKRYPCVHFVKVDVDENPHIAKTESVSFVPTFKIYKNGQKVREILGPSQQALEYAIKHYSM